MMDVILKSLKRETADDPQFLFWCPGCKYYHWFKTTGSDPVWVFDGDMKKPTVTPNILSTGVENCNLFIIEGMLHFLSDSTHELAGQTVDMGHINDGQ